MADFFISYTSDDHDRAAEINAALENAGFTTAFAGLDLLAGDNFYRWMRTEMEAASHAICICSAAYLSFDRTFSQDEIDAALFRQSTVQSFKLIPVLVEDIKLPAFLNGFVHFDLTEKSVADFVQQQITRLRGHLPNATGQGTKPGQMFGFPRATRVIGREDDLEHLRAALNAEGDVQLTNSAAILKGQGGIGKTTLARAYADAYRTDYDGLLWITAATRPAIIEGLMRIAPHFGVDVPAAPQEPHAAQVLAALDASGQDWLLIYDNVESYADFAGLEPQRAHLIATTRQGEGWSGFAVQDTDVLSYETEDSPAVTLLMVEAARDDDATGARDLAEALGGLPLALVIAGGLIKKDELGFADYLTQVERIIRAEQQNTALAAEERGYPPSVLGSVQLSYDKLPDDSKLVADLFAWWAPEGLEAKLFTDAPGGQNWDNFKDDIPEDLQALAADPDRVAEAIAALEDRSLVRRDGGTFAMHRMTAAALCAMQGETPMNGAAAALLAATYPYDIFDSRSWPVCRHLTPHVGALCHSGATPQNLAMSYLLNQVGYFFFETGDIQSSISFRRTKASLDEVLFSEDHPNVSAGRGALGMALGRSGDIVTAVSELVRAVELDERYRPGSAELATRYGMLGSVLLHKGRGGEHAANWDALRNFQKAAVIRRRLFPRFHDERAEVLNNMGTARFQLGHLDASLRLQNAANLIRERILPTGDTRLAIGNWNTGSTFLVAGRADKGELRLERAMKIWRGALLPEELVRSSARHTAGWLISAYLTRARAGERTAAREAKSRALCDEFGFDFDKEVEKAKQYPYTPQAY